MLFYVFYDCIFFSFFFFKQKTAYEMRISDWSSDVCSSDLEIGVEALGIDFERRRGLPLQRAVDLMPLDRALLREVLEDAGNDIARRVERPGVGAAPLEQHRRRAIIVGFRIGAVDQGPDLADTGIPAVGREQIGRAHV